MKLCQAKDDFELSVFFDIRPNQVSLVFSTWINFVLPIKRTVYLAKK